jgi:hypothetical protein
MEKWQVREYEAWFADMAREGLLVTDVATNKIHFREANPQELQYRLLDCRKAEEDEVVRRYAKKAGCWSARINPAGSENTGYSWF